MQREPISGKLDEAHLFSQNRARGYLRHLLRVPPEHIERIISSPNGAELVLVAINAIRKAKDEIKERRPPIGVNELQIALLESGLKGDLVPPTDDKGILEGADGSTGATDTDGKTREKPARGPRKPRNSYNYMEKDALHDIRAEFVAFFLQSKNQVLYQGRSKLPWQLRMDRVINAWNNSHPEKSLRSYKGVPNYREKYDIHSAEDFERVFGLHPTRYTPLRENNPRTSVDRAETTLGGTLDEDLKRSQIGGNEPKGIGGGGESGTTQGKIESPAGSINKRTKALEFMNSSIAALKKQHLSYIRGKYGGAQLSEAFLKGELVSFHIDEAGNYHLSLILRVDGEEPQRDLHEMVTSLGFIHHLKANGWTRDEKKNTWSPDGLIQLNIDIPYIPKSASPIAANKGNAEDITTLISAMKGSLISFINAYTESLRDKTLYKGHDVGSAYTIPRYPEGYLLTQMKGKNITCTTGSRSLPDKLHRTLQDREKLLAFLEREKNTYPGIRIGVAKNETLFVLEQGGYTLELFTAI